MTVAEHGISLAQASKLRTKVDFDSKVLPDNEERKLMAKIRLDATIDTLCNMLEKVGRLLSREAIDIHRSSGRGSKFYPAWTQLDGSRTKSPPQIFLNDDLMVELVKSKELNEFVRIFKGANYHELAHVLFSARNESVFYVLLEALKVKHADAGGVWTAFMMLEDQRIETLYTTKYEASSKYFTASSLEFLIDHALDLDAVHMLTHGRKYLPANVRAMLRTRSWQATGRCSPLSWRS